MAISVTLCLLASTALLALAGASAASAEVTCASCTPWWQMTSSSLPDSLVKGGEGEISLLAEDLGDAPVNNSPIVLTDKLPPGVTAQSAKLGFGSTAAAFEFFASAFCTIEPHEVACTFPEEVGKALMPNDYAVIQLFVHVAVAESAKAGEENQATVSGGGAPTATVSRPLAIGTAAPQFGIEQYELRPEGPGGAPSTQAGAHPFQLTTVINLNQSIHAETPPAAVKDLRFNLPAGLIGNPTPFPVCKLSSFLGNAGEGEDFCPNNTVVGVASVSISLGEFAIVKDAPLFALVPSFGEPARFGFDVLGVPVYLDTSVRTGGDYGVTVTVPSITEVTTFLSSRVTFWGVPADPRHDPARGWSCLLPEFSRGLPCNATEETNPPPLLTMPTSCTGPVHTNVEADSWQEEGVFPPPFDYVLKDNLGRPVGMDGCNQLPFTPSVKVTPDGQAASTPTGLTVDEHVPQETSLNATGLAESAVKGLSVTLPAGVALNPAAADGLQACSLAQIELESRTTPACPEASKLATVKIKTPLLPNALEGAAYLAEQDANPFGSLVAMYIYAEDPASGVRAKAAGKVLEDQSTGQITAEFEQDPFFASNPRFAGEPEAQFLPEVPFEDIELHFFGGDRAPLATPAQCGPYTTTGTFLPWSENETTESSSTFTVDSGANGAPCQNPLPFAPALTGGTTSIQAGGFSPFTMTMSRSDGNQNLQAIELHMPPGLAGTLSTVALCPEPQADEGTCGPESLIGETIVSVGVGGDPYSVTGGKVYITGPYEGAPFGLSIVNPAKAGPFDLGEVVVRAKIEVDPTTAALTITTDNSGPYKIPHILDGIPLQIQHVNVTINRPNFTFNPTNCSKLQITGTLSSVEGASSPLSVPFQATNCAVLSFQPHVSASTSGKTSRASGASLHVKLTYTAGPYDTNIAKFKLELPRQLPSRLSTLQKACTAATFDVNPAGCPAASRIGQAHATTPLIPVPLDGPLYFVSHGGAQFPEVIVVLQGYGVTIDLHGQTFISPTGVTSSTFETVPDAPVGTFEATLPEGPDSALAANGNLCTSKLVMPTEITAQNGAEFEQSTKIAVTGCPKATKAKKKHKVRHERGKKKHRSRKSSVR